jgi:hypothetical protein
MCVSCCLWESRAFDSAGDAGPWNWQAPLDGDDVAAGLAVEVLDAEDHHDPQRQVGVVAADLLVLDPPGLVDLAVGEGRL